MNITKRHDACNTDIDLIGKYPNLTIFKVLFTVIVNVTDAEDIQLNMA